MYCDTVKIYFKNGINETIFVKEDEILQDALVEACNDLNLDTDEILRTEITDSWNTSEELF